MLLLLLAVTASLSVPSGQLSLADHVPNRAASQPEYAGLHKVNPVERAQAVQAIRAARDTAAVHALIEQLTDPDQMVGLYVAQALGELATADALDALRTCLRSADPNVRWRAALALGERRDVNAVAVLARALRDPEILVQNSAAEALAQIATQDAIQSLVAALTSSQESIIHIVMAALQTNGEAAVPALTQALTTNNPTLRMNAATTLGYIASPLALPALQLATADPDASVRAEATWAINQTPQKR